MTYQYRRLITYITVLCMAGLVCFSCARQNYRDQEFHAEKVLSAVELNLGWERKQETPGTKKDTRAEFPLDPGIREISVSPDETIWIVSDDGPVYYTNSIDESWHNAGTFAQDTYYVDRVGLGRISFFNKDTAILSGSIGNNETRDLNGIYRTVNGGRNWTLIDFQGDDRIFEVCVFENGNAWMGGSSGSIYFSKDFGETWTKLSSPFEEHTRIRSIFMVDENIGFAGAFNTIYKTSDNWKTWTTIETPQDQGMFNAAGSGNIRNTYIEKIRLLGNTLIAGQNGRVFAADMDTTQWKPLPGNCRDFETDPLNQLIYAVDKDNRIIIVDKDGGYAYPENAVLEKDPMDMKTAKGSLYVIDRFENIYRINQHEFTKVRMYTRDFPIPEPPMVNKQGTIAVGTTGRDIYVSENSGRDWYRQGISDFWLEGISLLDSGSALLWDGKKNYRFDFADKTTTPYNPVKPLETFLKYPVKQFTIESGGSGCFGSEVYSITYSRREDSFVSSRIAKGRKKSSYRNRIDADSLENILRAINNNPQYVSSIDECEISPEDRKNYLKRVSERLKYHDNYSLHISKNDEAFYISMAEGIDTVDAGVIGKVLLNWKGSVSTSFSWFRINIINENYDTVQFKVTSYSSHYGNWNLPWIVEYKGNHFACRDFAFSKFILECVPEDFLNMELFDKSLLINQAADYLSGNDIYSR